MRTLATVIEGMPVDNAWLDGEVVVLTKSGVPDFNTLQNAFDRRSTAQLTFFAFDIPFLNGKALRDVPFAQRRNCSGSQSARHQASASVLANRSRRTCNPCWSAPVGCGWKAYRQTR
ncbi:MULTISPECIES: hypothetical protein [unclassified Caballeronia]|jgi:hypothetical protein|uniref:ATP-dependent DNA ligase n=1 Tax=unclassified Caballeronia TaxID=2646786 RepID=UPI00288B7F27|nr:MULTISPECIES: hypothetical protein [unclassified Caballeronia]